MKVRNLAKWLMRSGCCREAGYCGFSGGADSTALLLALHLAGVSVVAVHFHHGLRGKEADADAEWCRDFCAARGIPFRLEYLDVPSHRRPRESLEQCGRRLRLERWRDLTGGDSSCPVYLAHHADDAMENLFLRIARGAGKEGLSGFAEDRVVEWVRLVRPFLSLRKAELEAWLHSQNIQWRVDATNNESDCRRNAVRNRLLPLWKEIFGTDEGLYHAVEHLRNPKQIVKPRKVEIPLSVPQEILWDWQKEPVLQWGEWGTLHCLPADAEENGERFAELPCPLLVRRWRFGDRMRPFGWTQSKKLQDLFTDAKIPQIVRQRWPIVLGGEEIVWVPGVRRAEFGRCEGGEGSVCLAFRKSKNRVYY